MCFHAQEDGVGSQTGETPFKVRLAPKFFSFCVEVIQRSDSFFKLLPINLQEKSGLAVKVPPDTSELTDVSKYPPPFIAHLAPKSEGHFELQTCDSPLNTCQSD